MSTEGIKDEAHGYSFSL